MDVPPPHSASASNPLSLTPIDSPIAHRTRSSHTLATRPSGHLLRRSPPLFDGLLVRTPPEELLIFPSSSHSRSSSRPANRAGLLASADCGWSKCSDHLADPPQLLLDSLGGLHLVK
ncbi:hypothetical protein NL676_001839 [Syzygium grande]|nr:hypothetical protein NL676_001839 [Syzygium grande]